MMAVDLLDLIRRCANDAITQDPGNVEHRAHTFIACLAGALENHDAIGSALVFSLLSQIPAQEAK